MKSRRLLLIIAAVILILGLSAFALFDVLDIVNYRIYFEKGIKLGPPVAQRNLETVSDSLVEVVFTADTGDDSFTIGCYLGNEDFSLDYITQRVKNTVDRIKDDIANNERISPNNAIEPENLELFYIVVKKSPSRVISKLSGVEEVKRISRFP